MALVHTISNADTPKVSDDDAIGAHFKGNKAAWRKSYDMLIARLNKFGADIQESPAKSYISLVRGIKKFAVVQISGERLDLGIKLKGIAPTERLGAAGSWNVVVTHRVRISDPKQLDSELLVWLKQAYDASA